MKFRFRSLLCTYWLSFNIFHLCFSPHSYKDQNRGLGNKIAPITFNESYFFFNGKEKPVYVPLIKEYKKVLLFSARHIVIICTLKHMPKMHSLALFSYTPINCIKTCFHKRSRDSVRKQPRDLYTPKSVCLLE